MIRKYLQLARLPNVFTAPTNIMAGYLTITPVPDLHFADLGILMTSSALLYASGIIFNDYFDVEEDRKERPFRPIPSGKISRETALRLGIVLMSSAVLVTIAVSWESFAISVLLAGAIIAYDYRLKHSRFFGPLTMGGTRFLNVILGASPSILQHGQSSLMQPLFAAASVLSYVVIISVLSRKETVGTSQWKISVLISLSYAIAASIAIATVLGFFKVQIFSVLIPFVVVQSIILKQSRSGDAVAVQGGIKWMVISIIILDSAFVSGAAGLPYGLATLLFLAPSVILSRRFYVT